MAKKSKLNAFFDKNATTVTEEDVKGLRKMMSEAQDIQTNEQNKATNKAPKYTTLPSLDETSKKSANKSASVSTNATSDNNTVTLGNKTFKVADSAKKSTSLESKDNYSSTHTEITDENAKKELTKEQYKEYKADKKQTSIDRATNKREKQGITNPVLSTAESVALAPIAGVEGGIRTLGALATGDKSLLSSTKGFTNAQNELRQGVKTNMSDTGQTVYDIGTGVGDMAANFITGALSGGGTLLAGALMGGQKGIEATEDAYTRNNNVRQSALYGTLAGGAEGYFNTVGLDALKGAGLGVKGILRAGGVEGLENLAQSAVEDVADAIVNNKNSQFATDYRNLTNSGVSSDDAIKQIAEDALKQYGADFATGAAFGTALGGAKSLLNKATDIPRLNKSNVDTNTVDDVDTSYIDFVNNLNNAETSSSVGNESALIANARKNTINNFRQNNPVLSQNLSDQDILNYLDAQSDVSAQNFSTMSNIMNNTDNNTVPVLSRTNNASDNGLDIMSNDTDISNQVADFRKNNPTLAQNMSFNDVVDYMDNRSKAIDTELINKYYDSIATEEPEDNIDTDRLAREFTSSDVVNDYDNQLSRIQNNYGMRSNAEDYVNESALKDLQFDSDVAKTDFDKSYSDWLNAVEKMDKSTSTKDLLANIREVESTQRKLSSAIKQGYYVDKNTTQVIANLRRSFGNKTKGVVINIPDSMRNEYGLNDKTIAQLNNEIRIGKDSIKFSRNSGTPIDEIWEELNTASGNALDGNHTISNSAEQVGRLLEYVSSLKNNENAKVAMNDRDVLNLNDFWDDLNENTTKMYEELGTLGERPLDTSTVYTDNVDLFDNLVNNADVSETTNNPNRQIAERILGLWQDTNEYDDLIEPGDIDNSLLSLEEDISGGNVSDWIDRLQDYVDDYESGDATYGDESTLREAQDLINTLSEINNETVMNEDIGLNNRTNTVNNIADTNNVVADTNNVTEYNSPYMDEETTLDIPYSYAGNPTRDADASRVVTHSAQKANVIHGIAKEQLEKVATYEVKHGSESWDSATKLVDKYGSDNLASDYISGKRKINGATGVDASMMCMEDLTARYDEAIESGNIADATWLNVERIQLLSKIIKFGTKAGQDVQAFSKWNRTPTGAIINATRIEDGLVQAWKSTHKSQTEATTRIAKILAQMSNDTEASVKEPLSADKIRQQVADAFDNEHSSISKQFSDDDFDYLTVLLNNGVTDKEITDALNTKLATGHFGVSEEVQKQVNDLYKQMDNYNVDSKEYVDLESKAFSLLADEVCGKASIIDKFNAWRYLAMLGNPKTMLRNFLGNQAFGITTGIANNIAAGLETTIDGTSKLFGGNGINRTKAILNPVSDKSLISMASKDAENARWREVSGTKYEKSLKTGIESHKQAFDSKFMRGLSDLVDKGISDTKAVQKKYSTSLAGYLKANGYDESIFDAETQYNNLKKQSKNRVLSSAEMDEMDDLGNTVDFLEKARDYAVKQAEYATFHEDNVVANILTEASQKLNNSDNKVANAFGKVVEGIMPFKKTPANILKSGIEFSPLNAIDSIAKTGKLILDKNKSDVYTKVKGNKTVEKTAVRAADVIESWSKTLTGTGLLALGAYLYDKDILQVADNDTKYQDQLEGKQNYSLKIGKEDGTQYTATIDWLAPDCMPLLLGAEVSKIWNSAGRSSEELFNNFNNIDSLLNAGGNLLSPLVETSMMSGVEDTLNTISNATRNNDTAGSALSTAGVNAITGYYTQAIPTLSGQIARTVDNTRRSTYTQQDGLLGTIAKQGIKKLNSIPGLSTLSNAYVDNYGRQQDNAPTDNILGRAAYQFLSPSYIQKVNTTDADTVSREAYETNKDTGTLSEYKGSLSIDGQRVDSDTYSKYATAYGQANYKIRTELANSKKYQALDDDMKEEIIKKVNNIADKKGMAAISSEYKEITGKDYTTESDDYKLYLEGGVDGLIDHYTESAEKKENKSALQTAGVNNPSDTDSTIYADKGESSAKVLATLQKTGVTSKGSYTAQSLYNGLSSMNMSDSDKGYYIVNKSQYKLANKAQAFADSGDYKSVYQYYQVKNELDANKNGKLDSDEKKKLVPALEKLGLSDQYDTISTWY